MDIITQFKHTPFKVSKAGFRAVDLYFDSCDKANRLLNDNNLKAKIMCDIIDRNAFSRGVISDLDGDLRKLGEAIVNKGSIENIERMVVRKFDYSEKKVIFCNTNNYIIKFKGRSSPEFIELYNGLVKIKVRPFIPSVKQCFNCYQFGHTKSSCKNNNKICLICGDKYHGYCERQAKCTNCGENHKANDKKCAKYLYNKQLLKVSAKRKVSIYEAKVIVKEELCSNFNINKYGPNLKSGPVLSMRSGLVVETSRLMDLKKVIKVLTSKRIGERVLRILKNL